ncbi:PglY protein [Actinacidiphila bryophytorum]|uniref:PglY protein n=1 Tax=Actinacidiphila bryophytorum TaxID=1436133 RepID=A0A9W4EDE6_9ACTN|nr:PglY protein [Actinacidiphila bryophytorum]MBM9434616.1 PglY protein [Actinacidiphila bryophytorum]MBN6543974.1 PglY protein [Actinacidiphila bryophytorum]CAG7628126.1 PglY protein [Actinacidiphila bryophytorum]
MPTSELFLRDVIDIKEDVHAGDFKVELSGGFTETDQRVAEYVVTDQLRNAFKSALALVGAAVRTGTSHAAYLHGSFGAGKSHFLTVLHAVLQNHPAARAKPRLQEVIAEHDDWLRRNRFLMVPYHLVGSVDLDSALLGGYVATVRKLHPDQPTPAVYRADAAVADALRQRAFLADDTEFARWLGSGGVAVSPSGAAASAVDEDDLDTTGFDMAAAPVNGWTTADLDRAFAAPAGDPYREALVSALLSGPMAAYATGARGDKDAFLPLENGLAVVSRHAQSLGYDGIVLFLDELILWLQAHMGEQDFVRDQVQRLVKLIESGDSDRPVPIVSFISRQRDLSQLIGSDVAGAEVQNLEQQVQYLAGRIDVVDLEDSNLIEIIKHRVLSPKPGMESARESAFAAVESSADDVRQVLLDASGRTEATWDDFRDVYPLSPAFLNVLVELAGALQRERTGLKLVEETLRRRRDDLKLGELIPLGDLWDVIVDGTGEAFTARLRKEAETAKRFHARVVNHLLAKYGSTDDTRFKGDERLVKTLLLAALAPNVPALSRLTGDRLAALNHGSIKVRLGSAGSLAVKRLKELQSEFGELRSEGGSDPVFHLHLADLDIEPLLASVSEGEGMGPWRVWVKDRLWTALGIPDAQAFISEREIVWRGTRRTAEFVFGNVSRIGSVSLPDEQFLPQTEGNIRFVIDYPFAEQGYPSDDVHRVDTMKQDGRVAPTLVWLPHFLSEQKRHQLVRLLKIDYLLERDRLTELTPTKSADERVQIRHQLKAQSENLTSSLTAVLQQMYGLGKPDPGSLGAEVPDNEHLLSLEPAFARPKPQAGLSFEQNLYELADGMFSALYPKHPDFDPARSRKAVTRAELRTAMHWITEAMKDGSRRVVVDRHHLPVVKKIVHPLGLGEVHDGPLNLLNDWRLRINQKASEAKAGPEIAVEDIRRWIVEMGWTGLDRTVANLIIATYALLDDRTWIHETAPVPAPELERIGPGYGLRAVQLPSEEDFGAARTRAATIFGVSTQPVRFARNVAAMETGVREVVERYQQAVEGVRRSLDKHADDLGITGPEADRMRSMRAAADLMARLSRARNAVALVGELASASYDVTDQELAAAVKHSPEVLDALDGVNWSLLQSVRSFMDRQDGVGDRAERLVASVRDAANSHEQATSLVPALSRLADQSVSLVTDAARLAAVAQPVVSPPAPPAAPAADDVSLTVHGTPAVSSGAPHEAGAEDVPAATPTARTAGRPSAPHVLDPRGPGLLETVLAAAVGDVQEDIRSYVAEHPGVAIEIVWRPLDGGGEPFAADDGADRR